MPWELVYKLYRLVWTAKPNEEQSIGGGGVRQFSHSMSYKSDTSNNKKHQLPFASISRFQLRGVNLWGNYFCSSTLHSTLHSTLNRRPPFLSLEQLKQNSIPNLSPLVGNWRREWKVPLLNSVQDDHWLTQSCVSRTCKSANAVVKY